MIVVLFSGGIDSLAHLAWATRNFAVRREKVVAVYYDVGQAYAHREIPRARKIADRWGVRFDVLTPMVLPEDGKTAQVELRNLHMILWTATLFPDCEGVVFGMLQGETPPDKTPRFTRRLQAMLDDLRAKSIYGDGRPFRIHTPFAKHTKTEMLRWYTDRYGPFCVYDTVGCFAANEPMCGECWSCFNRWLAFERNHLGGVETYATHPASAMIQRLRAMLRDRGSREWRGASLTRAWARRRWLFEAKAELDTYCRAHYYGASVLHAIRA